MFSLEPPSFSDNDVQSEVHANLSQSILLSCSVHGHPFPSVVWFRGKDPIDCQLNENLTKEKKTFRFDFENSFLDDRNSNFFFHSNGSLEIRQLTSTDHDRFQCVATNPAGTIRRSIQINVNGKEKKTTFLQMIFLKIFFLLFLSSTRDRRW